MASGHVYRANRPNTWLLRPSCNVKILLANPEPSTHGLRRTFVQTTRCPLRFSLKCGVSLNEVSREKLAEINTWCGSIDHL
jgi:hypothetical protein